jgi:hypothetical protein
MATYIQIGSTVTVGAGGAAFVEFTSIPATYTDLKLVMSARSNRASNADPLTISLNSSTSGISFRTLYGNGSGTGSYTEAGDYFTYINAASSTSNTFSSFDLYLPNYTSSTNKSWSVDNAWENNATANGDFLVAGLQTVTSAVTSVKISTVVGSFVQYTTASLYGISKS